MALIAPLREMHPSKPLCEPSLLLSTFVSPWRYPRPIWNKATGEIDRSVANAWRDNYDLVHIMQRDWQKGLGEKLRGKIHLYVGELDNYYLESAVMMAQVFTGRQELVALRHGYSGRSLLAQSLVLLVAWP